MGVRCSSIVREFALLGIDLKVTCCCVCTLIITDNRLYSAVDHACCVGVRCSSIVREFALLGIDLKVTIHHRPVAASVIQ